MKVLIITQDEPFFIPKMISKLVVDAEKYDYEIVGVTILRPFRKNKSLGSWIIERAKVYSISELLIVSLAIFYVKLNSFFYRKKSNYSVKSILKNYMVKNIRSNDINDNKYLTEINKLDIDIIISISCPQLFKNALLNLPRIACINAHGTLLPRHRGVFGSWWTLFCGDEKGGSTIHTMVEAVDKGDIIWQKSFIILKEHTQYSIAYQTKKDMAEGLIEVIQKYKAELIKPLTPYQETSYHYAPSRIMGKEFHKLGKRIIVLRDLKKLLCNQFITY